MSDYLVGLESSGWLRHIKAVVDAANFLTKVSEVFHFAIHPLDPEILLSEQLKRSVMQSTPEITLITLQIDGIKNNAITFEQS